MGESRRLDAELHRTQRWRPLELRDMHGIDAVKDKRSLNTVARAIEISHRYHPGHRLNAPMFQVRKESLQQAAHDARWRDEPSSLHQPDKVVYINQEGSMHVACRAGCYAVLWSHVRCLWNIG